MITSSVTNETIPGVLKIDMRIDGGQFHAGDVVPFSKRDFKYQETYGRALLATKENIAIVKAEAASAEKVRAAARAKSDELTNTRAQLAAVQAELEALKKGK